MGSFLLGAAMVAGGLSGNLAMAQSFNDNMPGASDTNGCGPSGDQPKQCASVPEPSSMILLGAGMAGLGFWAWRRKSTKG
jgi:PEP-CTERM motif-containing protein